MTIFVYLIRFRRYYYIYFEIIVFEIISSYFFRYCKYEFNPLLPDLDTFFRLDMMCETERICGLARRSIESPKSRCSLSAARGIDRFFGREERTRGEKRDRKESAAAAVGKDRGSIFWISRIGRIARDLRDYR